MKRLFKAKETIESYQELTKNDLNHLSLSKLLLTPEYEFKYNSSCYELVIVIISGNINVNVQDQIYKELGRRDSVF
jgi:5-deoxy-D-glucuronate isomerase